MLKQLHTYHFICPNTIFLILEIQKYMTKKVEIQKLKTF